MNSLPPNSLRLIFVGLMISVAGGCTTQPMNNEGNERSLQINGEEARAAIIALVEHSEYEELKMSVPFLQKAEIEQVDADPAMVHIGQWQFDLKKHTFVVTVDATPIFAEYQGIFRKNADSGWKASFSDIKRN